MTLIAAMVIGIFASFLVVIGIYMCLSPQNCLRILRQMGSTPKIHFSELTLRFLAGLGFYGFAARSPYTQAFHIIGMFLMVTSVMIMCVPPKLHNGYAKWWAKRLPPNLIRVLGLLPIALGAWLQTHIFKTMAA